jgi:hypothetical protein
MMLVQQEKVDVSEDATSMWGREEDVSRLLSKLLLKANNPDDVLIQSLWAVAAVINAIKGVE